MGKNVSPEELENKLALNPLVAEVIVTGEENGLTARIYPEQAVVRQEHWILNDSFTACIFWMNTIKNQPTYRRITGLVIRKIRLYAVQQRKSGQDVTIDEPQA